MKDLAQGSIARHVVRLAIAADARSDPA